MAISEFLNDPDGSDSGNEWFEVFNTTATELDLTGLTITFADANGTWPRTFVVDGGKVPAGSYFVLGDAPDATKPSWMNHSYGDQSGATMANASGSIFISCGTRTVDQVVYGAASPAHARQLDGTVVPDSTANDQAGNWCDAATALDARNYGTPGKANDACVSLASCIGSGGTSRPVVSPEEGELVITEFMARPAAAISDTGEWVEVYATADVDLNGLTLSSGTSNKTTLTANECLRMVAGTFFVLAKTDDPTTNGGLPAPAALFDFDLTNDPTTATDISLRKDGTPIDQVWYDASTEGVASQLDACRLDPYAGTCTAACKADQSCPPPSTANDDLLAFCRAEVAWGAGAQKGSPGAANVQCATAPDIKKCFEGGSERDVVRPALGDIAITEIMPKPLGAADLQSWFEVYAAREIDLNGLEISSGNSKQVLAPHDCQKVAAGTYIVFARSTAAFENGGLPKVDATFGLDLPTTGGKLTLSLDDGLVVLDTVNYLAPLQGQSIALDACKADPYSVPACTDACKADQSCPAASTANDDPVTFCPGTATYGNAGNKGSPGAANPICPAIIDPTKCLDNGTQRASVPPTVGSLVITEILAGPSGADDLTEWFEVYVKADADLNGLVLTDGGTGKTTLSSENCLRVTRGQYLVFGRSADPTLNGGIFTMAGVFGFSLSAQGSVVLKHGVDVIDFALYTGAPDGKALQLGSTATEPDSATNDVTTAFCAATDAYGTTGNLGTPGAPNGECSAPIDPDTCTDSGQTTPRAVFKPIAGDLVISEVMAAPTGTQTNKEWVEIYFTKDVDLNGVEFLVGTTPYQILSTTCIRPGAGGFAVLARSADPALNGGLTNVAGTFGSDLSGAGGTLWLIRDSNVIDKVVYGATTSGYSQQLASTKMDATLNDSASAWCLADTAVPYGTTTGDHGTPGAGNSACLCASSTCAAETPCNPSNGACECTVTSCASPQTCDTSTKQCVTVDPNSCTDATSGSSRPQVLPLVGDLVITEYMADPSAASAADATGEWVEILVTANVDLNAVTLQLNGTSFPIAFGATCVRPGAGSYVVLARSADSSVNGGLTNVQGTFNASLANMGGQALGVARDGASLDTVTTRASTAGASRQLSLDKVDPATNDIADWWCNTPAGTTFGKGDRGTPGTANLTLAGCP